jgi:uncharacterized membrane protein YagU involved in acid resistance
MSDVSTLLIFAVGLIIIVAILYLVLRKLWGYVKQTTPGRAVFGVIMGVFVIFLVIMIFGPMLAGELMGALMIVGIVWYALSKKN